MNNLIDTDLFAALDLGDLAPEKKKELLDQMTALVEQRITTRVVSLLTDDEKKEMDALLEQNGDVASFLRSKIPEIESLTTETIANFKQEFLDLNQGLLGAEKK